MLPSVELQCLLPVVLPHILSSLLEGGAGRGQDTGQILYGVSHSQAGFMQLGVKIASVSATGSIWESWLLVFVPLC